jgi:hypothetical protein
MFLALGKFTSPPHGYISQFNMILPIVFINIIIQSWGEHFLLDFSPLHADA